MRHLTLPILAGLTAGAAFALGTLVPPAETPTSTEQVNVSIIYDQHGEAVDVDLTDQNGEWIPTGSIAESWPDDNEDAVPFEDVEPAIHHA